LLNRKVMLKRTLAAALLLAPLAIACSSSSAGEGGTPPPGSTAGSCKTYTVCSLLSAAQVSTAFGATFSAGMEMDANTTPSDSEAELVACNFSGPSYSSVNVSVRCCPCGDNTPAADQSEAAMLYDVSPVTGVGDSAFWGAPIVDAGGIPLDAYALNVFVGADLYVIVSINNPPSGVDPLAGAKQIASTVLAGL
jgi:hypothetical protein